MTKRSSRRGGGRAARHAERVGGKIEHLRYITRNIPSVDLLSDEGLALIEENSETILEEIGIDFREDAEALELFKDAGADIDGERVRFPRGLARHLVSTAPSTFTQLARNPERSVEMGGRNLVFAPVYGPPFIYDIEKGRRYAQLEDFQNIVKLAYMTPSMHHSGGTVCEPVDVPVNKRHLDMVYAHMRYSDKPFMGSVTHPERAADSVEMARILFGADVVDTQTVMVSLINANSPMTFDATMLGALKVYARANQGNLVTPFIRLCCKLGEGAMRDQGASCSPYDSALARRSCSHAMASVRAHGQRSKARSTIRASPTMPPWRANIPAWPLRSARITSKPLIVA